MGQTCDENQTQEAEDGEIIINGKADALSGDIRPAVHRRYCRGKHQEETDSHEQELGYISAHYRQLPAHDSVEDEDSGYCQQDRERVHLQIWLQQAYRRAQQKCQESDLSQHYDHSRDLTHPVSVELTQNFRQGIAAHFPHFASNKNT